MKGRTPAVVALPPLLRKLRQFEFPHKLGICERLFGAAISPFGVCWVETAAALTWKLDLSNAMHRWIVYGGYEVPALCGAESLLKEQRIKAIYAELGCGNGQRIVDYLATFNYRCHLSDRSGRLFHAARLPNHTDGLLLPVL